MAKELTSLDKTNNYGVLRWVRLGFGNHTKEDYKYPGERKMIGTIIEQALKATMLIPERTYDENPLFELYVRATPMMWHLHNAEEFRTFISSMDRRMQERKLAPQEKCVLVLIVENDPELKTFNQTDLMLLDKYFVLLSLEDETVKSFFESQYMRMIDEICDFEGSKPEFPTETVCETLLRQSEKAYGKFEVDQMAALALGAIGGYIAADLIAKPFFGKLGGLFASKKPAQPNQMDVLIAEIRALSAVLALNA